MAPDTNGHMGQVRHGAGEAWCRLKQRTCPIATPPAEGLAALQQRAPGALRAGCCVAVGRLHAPWRHGGHGGGAMAPPRHGPRALAMRHKKKKNKSLDNAAAARAAREARIHALPPKVVPQRPRRQTQGLCEAHWGVGQMRAHVRACVRVHRGVKECGGVWRAVEQGRIDFMPNH